MWIIDLTFLQESANIFQEYFIDKYYKIYTYSGKCFLISNTCKNYPHLVGIRYHHLIRLGGSEYIFECIKNNDTSGWNESTKKAFNKVFPGGVALGNNDIKITFFPLMPDIFIKNNYVISVNYDRNKRTDNKPFSTEVLISDFNDGMSIGMKQRDDGSFGFNSWRVEENESKIMDLYFSQEIDLIKSIEQFEGGINIFTKVQILSDKNLWRLSRLVKNKNATIVDSEIKHKILFLATYEDNEFEQAINALKLNYEQ